MRTQAQIEASRRNGALSQGPITEEGKQRSSQNAVKHGLTARTVVLCTEDPVLFDQLEQDYIDSFRPCTIFELHLVQRIAVNEWRLRRSYAIATAINDRSMADNKAQDDLEHGAFDNDYRLGLNQKRIEKEVAPVHRAEAYYERSQTRALAEFHRQRKLRPPGAQPIQITRPDVSTTGRDPGQYLPEPDPVAPIPAGPGNQEKVENPTNEPKAVPEIPVELEPCIIIPDYPKCEEDELEDSRPTPPNRRLAS